MTSNEKLFENYRAMFADDQTIVKIAAVMFEPFQTTQMVDVFQRYSKRSLDNLEIKNRQKDLVKQGYLETIGHQYQVNKSFSDYLLDREYRSDTNYREIAEVVQKVISVPYWYGSSSEAADRYMRDLRIAYYGGVYGPFRENYLRLVNIGAKKYAHEDVLEYFLPTQFDKAKLEFAMSDIRAFLLHDKLNLMSNDLTPKDEYFQYAVDFLPKPEESIRQRLARKILQIAFLRGEFDLLDKLSPHCDTFSPLFFKGWHEILRGSSSSALEYYALSGKAMRKELQNPKALLGNLEGVFQMIAQIATQDATYYTKIEDTIKRLMKEPTKNDVVYNHILAVVAQRRNEKQAALNLFRNVKPELAFQRLFYYIALFWVDESLLRYSEIIEFYDYCKKNGYRWMASEIAAILVHLAPNEVMWVNERDAFLKELGTQPLINLLEKVEEWETALNALLSIGSTAKVSANVKENDSRVVWLVDFEHKMIQPKEQVYGKNGWSNGRNIALGRLKKGDVPNMSDQDRRISRGIEEYYSGWGGSSQAEINPDVAFPAMVGHPLLFLLKSPAIAVQLTEEKPVLVAKQVSNGYHLQFSQPITHVGFNVVKETPTRYKLLNVTEDLYRIAKSMHGDRLFIPDKGSDRLKEAISNLSRVVTIQSALDDDNNDMPIVETNSKICVHLLPIGDGFHIELYTKPFGLNPPYFTPGKGEATVFGENSEGQRAKTKRNLDLEKKNAANLVENVEILRGIKPTGNTWELVDNEQCLNFLLALNPLMASGDITIEWPKGEKFRISKIAGFDQFSMNVKAKNDWFEVSGKLQVDENTVLDMQQLLALSQQTKGQFIELSPGKFLALTNEFRKRLSEISGLLTATKNGALQLHPLAAPSLQDFSDLVKDKTFDKKYKESLERLKTAFSTKFTPPENFAKILRGYQVEGFEWLSRLAAWGVGACLADDMGLGKTVQALALIQSRADNGPTLVVAPASVCRNWVAEIGKFTPTLTPILFGEGERDVVLENAKARDIVITTYDLMTREADIFSQKHFQTIILDEAQSIKNRSTKRSETAMQLQGDFKVITTGTPLENHLGELWNLFQFINPGMMGSLDRFQEQFAIPIEKMKDVDKRDQLRRLVQPFMLRRRKDEVLKELPPKTEITLTVELTTEERAFYEAIRRKALETIAMSDSNTEGGGARHLKILAEIMKLRRAACHPKLADINADFIDSAKLRMFGEIVEELLDNGHKALVFSQFVGHLAILEKYLKSKNVAYQYLDGQTPLPKRQQRIEAFQRGEGDLFLISLKAGGVGLNLTSADYVIHMDPWWNPAVEDQATDRAHRIGQTKPVTVYRIVAEGTIEEKIVKLHEHKRDLADSLLEGADMSARLNADDLLDLIKNR
jgi:superfamily II DNA or RNA helicase